MKLYLRSILTKLARWANPQNPLNEENQKLKLSKWEIFVILDSPIT